MNASAAISSAPRQARGHFVLIGVIFLAALAASCAVLERCLPFPEVSMVWRKVEHLAQHGDEYDVLFIGSSRVESQIMPAIFDRVAGENGVAVKSFNAGIPAMVSPEDGYLLEEMLRRPHRRLRWVFVEISRLEIGVDREGTSRFGYWHDAARLLLLARRFYAQAITNQSLLAKNSKATFCDRCRIWNTEIWDFWGHARQGVMRAVNLGRGAEVLNRWVRAPGVKLGVGKGLGETGDGWLPAGPERQHMAGIAREQYERTYAERLVRPVAKDRDDPISQLALDRILSTVTRCGATPILILPPTTVEQVFFPTVERERQVTILDFSDVRENAGLFASEHRRDVNHLNTVGAELFTETLARRFVEIAKRGKAP